MASEHPRYQIVEVIAQGDFATVYRGVDRELDREVAIKQIHDQYLADPKQLERYWQEAQLLARLEHPYIMTIYDIVKDRGWLILELMQGSLQQKLSGQPIDVEDLRLTLIYMCQALKFLQDNGIVHGDVKPSNLLLDKNHRVKLGDFGIARRLAQHDGSVLKGTTKYMAPEVVSDQFGDVGPQSDLYSLGFSAYELLCGEHFDSLFPGLNMYGRDPQVAWMMWHGALDRKLPAIGRVLEGVPDETAKVIEKLVAKDPRQRYSNADEVIFDLKARAEGKDPDAIKAEAEQEKADEAERKKKRMKWAYGAVGFSMLMTLLMIFIPSGGKPDGPQGPIIPQEAILELVDLDRGEMILSPSGGGKPVALIISEKDDITLNGQQVELSSLLAGDLIEIKDGATFRVYKATRPETETSTGRLAQVDASNGRLYVEVTGETEPIEINVPFGITPRINAREANRGRPLTLADLQAGDNIEVDWLIKDEQVLATRIAASREVTQLGKLVQMNPAEGRFVVEIEEEPDPVTFVVSQDCQFSLNGTSVLLSGKVMSMADLRTGDLVELTHGNEVSKVAAERTLQATGTVTSLSAANRSLAIKMDQPNTVVAFQMSDEATVIDQTTGTTMPWSFVRLGDQVELDHTAVDYVDAIATELRVEPKAWSDRWAIVVACDDYDDAKVSPLPAAKFDADVLNVALTTYYRVPADRMAVLRNPTRLAVSEQVQQTLGQIGPNDQLLIYFIGHGYLDEDGEPWLATQEFELARIEETGLSLRKLIRDLEQVSTRETLLFLETCHNSPGEDRRLEPSAVELLEPLKRSPVHPVSTAVTLFASSDAGERGQQVAPGEPNLFTQAMADLWTEGNDTDQNGSVDADEIIAALPNLMDRLAAQNQLRPQTPIRLLADDRPPRLTPEQKESVLTLLEGVSASRFDAAFKSRYESLKPSLDNVPDGDLAYGLVAHKHNMRTDSRKMFERVISRFPKTALAFQGLALQDAALRRYDLTLQHLIEMVDHLPELVDPVDEAYATSALQMAGSLRQFLLDHPEIDWGLDEVRPLDEEVLKLDESLQNAFRAGVEAARQRRAELQSELTATDDDSKRKRLEEELSRAGSFADLEIGPAVEFLRYHLDDR